MRLYLKTKSGKIIMCLCELIVGILLLVNPVGFTAGIISSLGVVFIVLGVVSIVRYFKTPPEQAVVEKGLTKGLIEVSAGFLCIFGNKWIILAFPLLTVVYGIGILITGITKIQWTVDMLRLKTRRWFWSAIGAVLTIICGVIILCNPFGSTSVLWTFIAIALIVQAVIDAVVTICEKPEEIDVEFKE